MVFSLFTKDKYDNPLAGWLEAEPSTKTGHGTVLHPSTPREDNLRALHTSFPWGDEPKRKSPPKVAEVPLPPTPHPIIAEAQRMLNDCTALQSKIDSLQTLAEKRHAENCRRHAEKLRQQAALQQQATPQYGFGGVQCAGDAGGLGGYGSPLQGLLQAQGIIGSGGYGGPRPVEYRPTAGADIYDCYDQYGQLFGRYKYVSGIGLTRI